MQFAEKFDVTTDKEFVSLAQRLEHQAADNYDRLAKQMHKHQNTKTAILFEQLAAEERAHENAIAKIGAKIEAGKQTQFWDFPAEMTLHGDAGDPFLLTPYDAICFAIYNEGRTFELFTHIAARAKDTKLRHLAESFAKEELSHIAALRLARLDANRSLREMREELGWWTDLTQIKDEEDFTLILGRMENTTTATYENAAQKLKLLDDDTNCRFFNELSERAKTSLHKLKVEKQEAKPYSLAGQETSVAILLACLKYTDQTIDFVTFVAEKAATDKVYAKSSEMSERFSKRLSSIRERLTMLFKQ